MGKIQDLVVAPGRGMPGKAIADTDRLMIDRAGHDRVGAVLEHRLGLLIAWVNNRDMTGLIVVVIVIAGNHEHAMVSGFLGINDTEQLMPALQTTFGLKPLILSIGQQNFAVLWWTENIDAKLFGGGCNKGTAMSVLTGRVLGTIIWQSRLPIDMNASCPFVLDMKTVQRLGKAGPLWGNGQVAS